VPRAGRLPRALGRRLVGRAPRLPELERVRVKIRRHQGDLGDESSGRNSAGLILSTEEVAESSVDVIRQG
jgi:hypothetical protein